MEENQLFLHWHAMLSKIGFTSWSDIDVTNVLEGDAHTHAEFLRFVLYRFSSITAVFIAKYRWFVVESDDIALCKCVLRLLREEYECLFPLSYLQFSKRQFGRNKMRLCVKLIEFMLIEEQKEKHQITLRNTQQSYKQQKKTKDLSEEPTRSMLRRELEVQEAMLNAWRKKLNEMRRLPLDLSEEVDM